MGRIFGGSCLSDHRQFEYSDYCDGNNLYHDICSTSEDEDICRHSRCGNCSCDCRCKNSGNNDGNERKLPSAPYSCMAESGKYASEGGYQIMQALYAIGSGGFFGKGLGNSAQK